MSRWILLSSIALALSGCCGLGINCPAATQSGRLLASDGFNSIDAARPAARRLIRIVHRPRTLAIATGADSSSAQAELAALPKYSKEWWSVRDRIEAAADAKLARALVICRGCLSEDVDERTGATQQDDPVAASH